MKERKNGEKRKEINYKNENERVREWMKWNERKKERIEKIRGKMKNKHKINYKIIKEEAKEKKMEKKWEIYEIEKSGE